MAATGIALLSVSAQVNTQAIVVILIFYVATPIFGPPVIGHLCGWTMRRISVSTATLVGFGMAGVGIVANILWWAVAIAANSAVPWIGGGGFYLIPAISTLGVLIATPIICSRIHDRDEPQPSDG